MEQSDRCITNENFLLEEIQVNEDDTPASHPARHRRTSFQQSKLNRLLSTVSTISQAVRPNGLREWLILSCGIVWSIVLVVGIAIVIYIALFHLPS